MSSSFKDHHKIGSKLFTRDNSNSNQNSNGSNSNQMMKDSLKQKQQSYYGSDEYLSGFSWPPRSYTCSFCKREFRSAQALGGHMNVHRRDRARLRMSSPPSSTPSSNPNPNPNPNNPYLINLNLNPNPNPNFITATPPFASSFSSHSLASPSEIKKWDALTDALSPTDSAKRSDKYFCGRAEEEEEEDDDDDDDGFKLLPKSKAHDFVRLDLEIGLISDSKEDLDLELRLGYSN